MTISGKELLGTLSVIIAAVSYSAYFMSIFRGRTKPHMFSWIVWGTVSGVASYAQFAKGGGPGSWVAGASAVICFIVSVLAYFRGEKNITTSDWISFIGALAAIPLWYVTKEPLWSVILVVVIDAVGFYPTFHKSYFKPHEELALMYGLDIGKFVLSILAMETYSATAMLYPLTASTLNIIFISMLLYRRAVLTK